MGRRKVVILGAGHVGSHVASAIAVRALCEEIVLVDNDPVKASAQALDLADSVGSLGSDTLIRSGNHSECQGADLVIVAIGEPRKPGQTRLDLLDRSVEQADELVGQLKSCRIDCPIVTITNPVDIVACYLRKALEKERWRCFGTGTLLDTARLRRILSEDTGVSRHSITAFALGEHGDSSMVPFSCGTAGGLPLNAYPLDKTSVTERTHLSGMDIINGKGSTEFGIGAAAADMAAAILRNEHRVMAASVTLEGEYGQSGINCGVPCRIGAKGIEAIISLPLTEEEQKQLDRSCQVIRTHTERAESLSALKH